ncbi:MAG TPA: hypothetical protein VN377_02940 [Candidatus Thermoplasmatota archaeon]|nr:hypothetical protein [Candidatus Thermoplasmatota archaeon]
MTSKTNKIIGAVVAIAIIISIAVLVYVNLPRQTETPDDNNDDHKTAPPTLTLIYNDETQNFTFGQLERLESYTAKGGYRTQSGFIKGLGNYTGVNITTLVNMLQPIPPYHYTLQVFSDDGKNMSYNYSTIIGNVDIYNPENGSDPNPIGNGNMTMVLAYQFEGEWLNESSDGKLRIVFLDEQGSITNSRLWLKMVTSIKIITE